MATGRNDFHAVKENSHPTPSVTAMSVNMMASSMLLNFDEGIVLTAHESGWRALTRTAASKFSEPSFRIVDSEGLEERRQKRRHAVVPRHDTVRSNRSAPEWMATRDRAAPSGFHRTRSSGPARPSANVVSGYRATASDGAHGAFLLWPLLPVNSYSCSNADCACSRTWRDAFQDLGVPHHRFGSDLGRAARGTHYPTAGRAATTVS
nr:uncharacterized protein LOC126530934 isoform X4 [Dermacentor andersoni]